MFEKKTPCVIVAYERHEHEPASWRDSDVVPTYEPLKRRGRFMTTDSFERKVYAELAHAIDLASGDDHDGIIVVVYPDHGEDVLHALVAYQYIPGQGVGIWHGDDIDGTIQTIES